MNLSKALKKKRDAEARLRNQSPTPNFSSDGTTDSYIDVSKLATKVSVIAGLALKSDITHTHEIVDLTDVSITYTANAGKVLMVNTTEDGIELGDGGGSVAFTDLTDAPSVYTSQGGKLVAVKSTADGIEFISAPAATNGIPVGGTVGQLVEKVDGTDYNVQWADAPSAANGLPTGGTADQILSKIDATDYNTQWVDAPSGGGGITYYALFDDGTSVSGRTEVGTTVLFKAMAGVPCLGGTFYTVWSSGVVFTCKLWNSAGDTVLASKTFTGDGTTERKSILFDTPYDLTALTNYYISIERTSSSIAKYYGTSPLLTAFVTYISAWSGIPSGTLTSSTAGYCIGAILEV